MRIKLFLIGVLFIGLLFTSACGKKTDLVIFKDKSSEPTIVNVTYELLPDTFLLKIDAEGGSGAVRYQVDRAVVEPDCQCIATWFRNYESTLSGQRAGLQHYFKLRKLDETYAFRVRVIDSLGRKSAWSNTMKAKVKSDE